MTALPRSRAPGAGRPTRAAVTTQLPHVPPLPRAAGSVARGLRCVPCGGRLFAEPLQLAGGVTWGTTYICIACGREAGL